jgi:mercuric ion transport protein
MQAGRMTIKDGTLIATGAFGTLLAAICCATPLLAVLLGAVGLAAWAARADYVLVPAIILCLVLMGVGLYRRRASASTDPRSTP